MSVFYQNIFFAVAHGDILPRDTALRILEGADIDTLSLLNVAYRFRRQYYGKTVTLHVINNVQNGHCSEDCHYCAQSKVSAAKIQKYAMKSDEERRGSIAFKK